MPQEPHRRFGYTRWWQVHLDAIYWLYSCPHIFLRASLAWSLTNSKQCTSIMWPGF